jgi:hypothetical protein
MGKPSDQRRMAQRPGKSQRARVKNRKRRSRCYTSLPGTIAIEIVAGQKKSAMAYHFLEKLERAAHLGGEPHPESRHTNPDGQATRACVRITPSLETPSGWAEFLVDKARRMRGARYSNFVAI